MGTGEDLDEGFGNGEDEHEALAKYEDASFGKMQQSQGIGARGHWILQ